MVGAFTSSTAGQPMQKFQFVKGQLARVGCSISSLEHVELPHHFDVATCNRGGGHLELSDKVHRALEQLHAQYQFDLIEFGDYNALGFRAVQAKRAGLSFADVPLIVKLHGGSRWVLSANRRLVSSIDELSVDYCERYAFENADFQIAPTRYMLDYVKSIGWHVHDALHVVPYAYPDPGSETSYARTIAPSAVPYPGATPGQPPEEIVYFGRLETRKGVEFFADAVRDLPATLAVTFLGKESVVSRRVPAITLVKERLRGRQATFLTELDQSQAIEYLQRGNKLAVIPSLVDNLPNTVIECAVNNVPMIAARVGGIPEVVKGEAAERHLLFEPTTADVRRCIDGYLSLTPDERVAIHQTVRNANDPATHNLRVVQDYQSILQAAKNSVNKPVSSEKFGSNQQTDVAVVCGSHWRSLAGTLKSLHQQGDQRVKVTVCVTDQADPEAKEKVQELRAVYPQFSFIQMDTKDFASQANEALRLSNSHFFMLLRPPVKLCSNAVELLTAALVHSSRVSAFSCYQLDKVSPLDCTEKDGDWSAFRPAGGPLAIANLENVYGTLGIFRRQHLIDVGGFEPGCDFEFAYWAACIKLSKNNCAVDVVPEHLCSLTHVADGVAGPHQAVNRLPKQIAGLSADGAGNDRAERLYLAIKRHLHVQSTALSPASVEPCRACGTVHSQSLAHRVVDKLFAKITRPPRKHNQVMRSP